MFHQAYLACDRSPSKLDCGDCRRSGTAARRRSKHSDTDRHSGCDDETDRVSETELQPEAFTYAVADAARNTGAAAAGSHADADTDALADALTDSDLSGVLIFVQLLQRAFILRAIFGTQIRARELLFDAVAHFVVDSSRALFERIVSVGKLVHATPLSLGKSPAKIRALVGILGGDV